MLSGTDFVTPIFAFLHIYCCCSVAQSCPTLCDHMDCSTPGFPVLHHLPELTQTHVHRVGDAIQPSHPVIGPFSSCPQSFPASESFPKSCLFASGGQSIGTSASASILSMNIHNWFPLGLTGLISSSPRDSQKFSPIPHHVQKHQFFGAHTSFMVLLSHPYMTTGKTIALTIQTFVSKVMSLKKRERNRPVSSYWVCSKYSNQGGTSRKWHLK